MALERTPRPDLDQNTLDGLRAAFTESIYLGRHADGTHEALGRAAREARDKGIEPERLLITVKDVWYAVPRSPRTTPTDLDFGGREAAGVGEDDPVPHGPRE